MKIGPYGADINLLEIDIRKIIERHFTIYKLWNGKHIETLL